MTYVKLTARPDTWFKAATEAYHYDAEPQRRLTLAEWEQAVKDNCGVGVRGIRVTEDAASEGGAQVGEEREDGEWCLLDEFDVEMVEEPC